MCFTSVYIHILPIFTTPTETQNPTESTSSMLACQAASAHDFMNASSPHQSFLLSTHTGESVTFRLRRHGVGARYCGRSVGVDTDRGQHSDAASKGPSSQCRVPLVSANVQCEGHRDSSEEFRLPLSLASFVLVFSHTPGPLANRSNLAKCACGAHPPHKGMFSIVSHA